MRITSIASHGNGAGKTRLLTSLCDARPGAFAAVKFTTIFRDGQFCPKDQQRNCACSRLHESHEVITDAEVLAQPGTDTGRLVAAGASPVLWVLAREGAHAEAWVHARGFLPETAHVLTEGNTALLSIESDTLLFVVNPCAPRKAWKTNWQQLAERAAVVIVNESPEALGRRRPASREEAAAALAEVEEATAGIPRVVARFTEPFAAWAGPLLEDLIA